MVRDEASLWCGQHVLSQIPNWIHPAVDVFMCSTRGKKVYSMRFDRLPMSSVANPQRQNSGDLLTSIQSLLLGDRNVWGGLSHKNFDISDALRVHFRPF